MSEVNRVDLSGLFKSRQKATLAAQELNREYAVHQGTKGEATETSWISLLREYLPNRYAIERAMVVDSNGEASEQIDVVVFDRQYTPFVINYEGLVYVPAESVYAVFEVKQDISKEHIEYASKKFQSVRRLKRTSALITDQTGRTTRKELFEILTGILTLSSSWNPGLGDSFERAIHQSWTEQHGQIHLGCVLSEGGFRVINDNSRLKIETSDPEASLMYFLMSLFKMLQPLGTVPAVEMDKYLKWIE
ncbi:DUF6602 domain-containing protein [Bythopirellula goksoeyrii]|uniref:DUF6602 domain-containing protein n=1 Tax=Bythopirellula goksoeyrii TaxID=1400387 RepID=A0A5B9QNX9_9BACT|nr:DUF6602 domain-containing protein [Bythopirellula goksoeyrii]QEG35821.1 hypothetical protein Pr1d_31270 [Bythopirellula goksoeyrii]